MKRYKMLLEDALAASFFAEGEQDELSQAMRYSLLAGGKRLRGILCLAACEMAGGKLEDALPFAMAIEMIHAYSLIHDDLPAMDNDTMRRGKPTNHVVYGEAMAILAGDGLLTDAFWLMSGVPNARTLDALREVAHAAGSFGMVGGQALDMRFGAPYEGLEAVKAIHRKKTGCLITVPVVAGLMLSGASEREVEQGRQYGWHLGVAFQIIDDLLDLIGDEAQMGKHLGKDEAEEKMTWPAMVGQERARMDAKYETDAAVLALDIFGEKAAFLRQLAMNMLERVN
ncbi:MAG: polyprenyl synthetase family protein [Clostridia bacterium]|nr:polyprenyl synthetase family protein [Clostridia bacterium]